MASLCRTESRSWGLGSVELSRYVASSVMTLHTANLRLIASWTLPFFHQHEIISLSIPSQPYFLTSTLTSGPSPHQQTIISCFGPNSSKPIFRRAIPAKLLQVCVSGVNATHSVDASSVELTAIARDGRTLRVGEDVKPFPKQIQSVSVSAATASAQGTSFKTTNLSIWEEMFGKNAFSSASAIDDAVIEPTSLSSKSLKDKRSKYSKVYDGPTTSLPPMSTLFDDFLNDFMEVKPVTATSLVPETSTVRFAGDGKGTSSVVDTASVISEDVAPLVDMHIKRVGMQDVQELGDWFKNVVLTSSDDARKCCCIFALCIIHLSFHLCSQLPNQRQHLNQSQMERPHPM